MNNIKLRAKRDIKNGEWYLDILPPICIEGNMVTQPGTLYFEMKFSSKNDAYEFGKKYLTNVLKLKKETINELDYE